MIVVSIAMHTESIAEFFLGRPPRRDGTPAVADAYLNAWVAANAEGAANHLSVDAIYCRHISRDLIPSGGEARGREDIARALRGFWASFDPLLYKTAGPRWGPSSIRLLAAFIYRHRSSGEILDGRLRLVLTLQDATITRVDEYYDRARVEAFIRLYGAASSRRL